MKPISQNVLTILEQENVNSFALIRIYDKQNKINFAHTTYSINLTVTTLGDDNALYLSDNGLAKIEPPIIEKGTDREAYKIIYIDPAFDYRAMIESGIIGAKATVYSGVCNPFNYTFGGVESGQPLLAFSDLIKAFTGVIDSATYAIDPIEGTVLMTMECASPMASLGVTKSYLTSKDALLQIDPTDTAYDQVFVGSKAISLLWGK